MAATEGMTVVVIDDTPMMRAGLRAILNRDGYVVLGEAGDGSAGLAQITKLKPKVVTLDLTMPGMTGLETLQQIKTTHPETFVVVVSSTDDQDVVKNAFALGAIGYVVKPFNAERILKVFSQIKAIAAKRANSRGVDMSPTTTTAKRAVVVESNAELRTTLRSALESAGYVICAEAESAIEGLTAIERERPDFVLINADLPELDGINALRCMLAVHPTLPVIVMSSSADRHLVTTAVEVGAKGFVLLPPDREKLLAAIQRIVK